jgi:hypothetical protein
MIDDPILEEIREYKKTYAAQFNYDLAAMVANLLELEKKSSRPVVNRFSRLSTDMVVDQM